MPKPSCSIAECNNISHCRHLCSKHYQRAKYQGTLDELAPNPSGPCAHCGGKIPATRRWGATFCSVKCKNDAMDAAKSAKVAARRTAAMRSQKCKWCQSSLADARFNQRYCSRKCNDDWRNDQTRLSTLRAKKAAARKCETCDGPIPARRSTQAIFCSYECKVRGGRSAHPDVKQKQLDYNREYLYGLTPDDLDQMLAEQDGACAICRTTEPKGKGDWHVDHCHATEVIRGLLCHHCNLGLGKFKDSPESLRAAADYLERAAATPGRRMRRSTAKAA